MIGRRAPGTRHTIIGRTAAHESGEIALARALLRQASTRLVDDAVHLYVPGRPVVVFGRQDTRLPGFADAVRAAERAGYDTAVRAVGGRVLAYTADAVVIDVVRHEPHAVSGMERRFSSFGERLAADMRRLGADARVGPVPGEYCPGAHSVNARGLVKLVGTAQRVVKDAWLLSAVVIVDGRDELREVLTDVHGHLDLAFEPSSVGDLASELPGISVPDVLAALDSPVPAGAEAGAPVGEDLAGLAAAFESDHRVGCSVAPSKVLSASSSERT